MKSKTYTIPFRRKREGRTHYRKRLGLLESGLPRLVVRKSLKNIQAQIVEFTPQGDKVLASAHSAELKKMGWKTGAGNIPAAYLVGLLIGKKALHKSIKNAVLDIGLHPSVKGGRIYAVVKGVSEAGLNIPHNAVVLPPKERLEGRHVIQYASSLPQEVLKSRFVSYIKNGISPSELDKYVNDCKKKIMSSQ